MCYVTVTLMTSVYGRRTAVESKSNRTVVTVALSVLLGESTLSFCDDLFGIFESLNLQSFTSWPRPIDSFNRRQQMSIYPL